jgi:hypothetical protein
MTDQQHPVTDIRICHHCRKPGEMSEGIERPYNAGRQSREVFFHNACWRLVNVRGEADRFRRRRR